MLGTSPVKDAYWQIVPNESAKLVYVGKIIDLQPISFKVINLGFEK